MIINSDTTAWPLMCFEAGCSCVLHSGAQLALAGSSLACQAHLTAQDQGELPSAIPSFPDTAQSCVSSSFPQKQHSID